MLNRALCRVMPAAENGQNPYTFNLENRGTNNMAITSQKLRKTPNPLDSLQKGVNNIYKAI